MTGAETPNAPIALTAAPEPLSASLPDFIDLLHATQGGGAIIGPDGAPFVPPVNVDVPTILSAAAAGVVSFVVLRDLKGTMAGAALSWTQPNILTGIVTAATDRFHMTPEARDAGGAAVLFEAVKADVAARGAVSWLLGERFDLPRPVEFGAHGFLPVMAYHAAWIGGAPSC